MLLIALDAGDDAEAARRLAALWVLDPQAERLPALAGRVLESDETRETLAGIVAHAPRWLARLDARRGRVISPDHSQWTSREKSKSEACRLARRGRSIIDKKQ